MLLVFQAVLPAPSFPGEAGGPSAGRLVCPAELDGSALPWPRRGAAPGIVKRTKRTAAARTLKSRQKRVLLSDPSRTMEWRPGEITVSLEEDRPTFLKSVVEPRAFWGGDFGVH